MAYASPVRAADAPARPAAGAGPARPPAANMLATPRDAFREKAEKAAKLKADKEAKRKGAAPANAAQAKVAAPKVVAPKVVAPKVVAPAAAESGVVESGTKADADVRLTAMPAARAAARAPVPAAAKPAATLELSATPKLAPRVVAPPPPSGGKSRRAKPVFTVHVNPGLVAAAASTVVEPPAKPAPAPAAPASPPRAEMRRSSGGGAGGGGGKRPPRGSGPDEKESVLDRDLMMGGLISSLLLLFLGWNMFGGKRAVAPAPPEPVLKVAEAPKPDAFPANAPVELRPQSPLPPAPVETPTPEATPSESALQAPPPALPAVKPAQAPPPAAGSACERVRTVQAYFCTASSELTPDMRSVLETQLADWKACLGGEALVVRGYADTRGASDFNVRLSTARADALRDFLKAHAVKVAEAKGEGELPGLADNQNCQNQRRVDVSIGEVSASAECAPPKDAPLPGCR